MRTMTGFALALAALASTPAFAAGKASCPPEPAMSGMHQRIASLKSQMDRIEVTQDRAEQRVLMDLHMKLMHEGMREIRKRELGSDCRMEMLGEMMEVMIRHQHAMHEPQERR